MFSFFRTLLSFADIFRKKLVTLDIRVIVNFIKYSDPLDDALQRHLVRMLVNLLYHNTSDTNAGSSPDSGPSIPILGNSKAPWTGDEELNHTALENVGVPFLIELYSTIVCIGVIGSFAFTTTDTLQREA